MLFDLKGHIDHAFIEYSFWRVILPVRLCPWRKDDCEQGFGPVTFHLAYPDQFNQDPPSNA